MDGGSLAVQLNVSVIADTSIPGEPGHRLYALSHAHLWDTGSPTVRWDTLVEKLCEFMQAFLTAQML